MHNLKMLNTDGDVEIHVHKLTVRFRGATNKWITIAFKILLFPEMGFKSSN